MWKCRANIGRVEEQIYKREAGQGTCINSPVGLYWIMRLYRKEEFRNDSGTEYVTWHIQYMYHTLPDCVAVAQGHHNWILSVETVAFTQLSSLRSKTLQPFLRDTEDISVCQRRAGHSFCRSECPVQPWVGKTCPAGICSKSCG